MPTTQNEAERITRICLEHMPRRTMKELFVRLDEEVGKPSDNDSVKQSFAMFRVLAEQEPYYTNDYLGSMIYDPGWFTLWLFLWLAHAVLVVMCTASFFVAPFHSPWFVSAPICFATIWVLFTPSECVLTAWENGVRDRMHWRPIRTFLGHYLFKHLYAGWDRLLGYRSSRRA